MKNYVLIMNQEYKPVIVEELPIMRGVNRKELSILEVSVRLNQYACIVDALSWMNTDQLAAVAAMANESKLDDMVKFIRSIK